MFCVALVTKTFVVGRVSQILSRNVSPLNFARSFCRAFLSAPLANFWGSEVSSKPIVQGAVSCFFAFPFRVFFSGYFFFELCGGFLSKFFMKCFVNTCFFSERGELFFCLFDAARIRAKVTGSFFAWRNFLFLTTRKTFYCNWHALEYIGRKAVLQCES